MVYTKALEDNTKQREKIKILSLLRTQPIKEVYHRHWGISYVHLTQSKKLYIKDCLII